MPSLAVTYSPRLSAAEQQLVALPARLRNLAPLLSQAIAPAAIEMLRKHWATEGAASGHPWAPLALSTLAARVRKGTASKGPLRDTDAMRDTLFGSMTS